MRALLAFSIAILVGACASTPAGKPGLAQESKAENAQLADLHEARAFLEAHKPADAIAVLDGVIQHYERAYAGEKRRVYCARSPAEVLLYMLTSAAKNKDGTESRDAIAIGPEWTTAYQMKGYALVELRDIYGARGALEKARALSPSNSVVLSELAYTYQETKDWQRMLALFVEAEEAAELSPDSEKEAERARALRGQGFALIELGRLDEAAALFRKCLDINPDDSAAKNELEYIAGLRAKSKQ